MMNLNSENSLQLRLRFLFQPPVFLTEIRCTAQCHLTCVQVQTLPTAQATPALTDSFSWGYDPYTHTIAVRVRSRSRTPVSCGCVPLCTCIGFPACSASSATAVLFITVANINQCKKQFLQKKKKQKPQQMLFFQKLGPQKLRQLLISIFLFFSFCSLTSLDRASQLSLSLSLVNSLSLSLLITLVCLC